MNSLWDGDARAVIHHVISRTRICLCSLGLFSGNTGAAPCIPARMHPSESRASAQRLEKIQAAAHFPNVARGALARGGIQMYNTAQKLIAEFIGTFALIFFGVGSICTDQYLHTSGGGLGLLGIALAHGLAIAIMVSALGHISGGQFNPAVSIAFWVTKRQSTLDTILYWIAQLAGAAAAAFLIKAAIPEEIWRAVALGTPDLARDFPVWAGMTLEAVTTFFLVLTVFATAVDEKGTFRSIAGFGIGLSITLGIIVAGPFTGGALNPERYFGPALAASHWAHLGVYMVGPLGGGFVAGLIYETLFLKKA